MHDYKTLLSILIAASIIYPFLDSERMVFNFSIKYLSSFGVKIVIMISNCLIFSNIDVFCTKEAITMQKHSLTNSAFPYHTYLKIEEHI